MDFRTEYKIKKGDLTLRPEKPIVGIGSCFATEIIEKMRSCMWNATNPLGTLFNPLSIEKALRLCLTDTDSQQQMTKSFFEDNGIIHSWFFDSRISSFSESESLEKFKEMRSLLMENILKGKTMIVTFGSAYCYFKSTDSEYVVANCHKQDKEMFERKRISPKDIIIKWKDLLLDLKNLVPELRVIFTVSPVRHIRDGLHENNLSKSILLMAVDDLCSMFNFCHYFPSYEIMNDDLRDYRFYASDLVHPSSVAIDYIWEKFKEQYMDSRGIEILKKGEAIRKRIQHRHIIATDLQILTFKEETERQIREFQRLYPDMLET